MTDHAQLQSSATTIDDLRHRITAAADAAQADGDESTAVDLYEVERALRMAGRRLDTVVRRLGRLR